MRKARPHSVAIVPGLNALLSFLDAASPSPLHALHVIDDDIAGDDDDIVRRPTVPDRALSVRWTPGERYRWSPSQSRAARTAAESHTTLQRAAQ